MNWQKEQRKEPKTHSLQLLVENNKKNVTNLSRMKMKEGTQLKMAMPRSAMDKLTRKMLVLLRILRFPGKEK